ncbi:hypothetical protein BS78_03G193400 [Paspalum vaginatum]|nr:hypothetical protein BS78_03G193400 [Paspalum vaginatum]
MVTLDIFCVTINNYLIKITVWYTLSGKARNQLFEGKICCSASKEYSPSPSDLQGSARFDGVRLRLRVRVRMAGVQAIRYRHLTACGKLRRGKETTEAKTSRAKVRAQIYGRE